MASFSILEIRKILFGVAWWPWMFVFILVYKTEYHIRLLYFWTYWYYKNIKLSFYFMFHHIGRNCWITLTDMFQISISCCCTIFILFCFVFVFNHYQNNRLLEPIIPFRWLLLRKVDYIILEKQCILSLTDVNGK